MAQWLVCGSSEDPPDSSWTPVTPAPGDLTPASGFPGHPHTLAHVHISMYTCGTSSHKHTHNEKKDIILLVVLLFITQSCMCACACACPGQRRTLYPCNWSYMWVLAITQVPSRAITLTDEFSLQPLKKKFFPTGHA